MPAQHNLRLAAAILAIGLSLSAANVSAYEAGDWLVRARLININPNDNSGTIGLLGTPVPGSGVSVDSAATLDIDFTYMFASHWGAELLLDTSSRHSITATGATLGGLGEIVNTRVLPPSLILQYHFNPGAKVQPYAGFGVNYTYFFDENTTASLAGALGGSASVDLDASWGLVGQVGADFALNDNWFLNVDLKYIQLDTTATIDSPGGRSTVSVDINPWVYGIGIGKHF